MGYAIKQDQPKVRKLGMVDRSTCIQINRSSFESRLHGYWRCWIVLL